MGDLPKQLESDRVKFALNPPLAVGDDMAKFVTGIKYKGTPLEIRADNRYKDGNIRIVRGVLRGNKRTVKVERLEPPKQDREVIK